MAVLSTTGLRGMHANHSRVVMHSIPPRLRPSPLCRLLTVGQRGQVVFYRAAFTRLATRLGLMIRLLFGAAPADSCAAHLSGSTPVSGGSTAVPPCAWGSLCAAADAAGQQATDHVSTCYCEWVFSLTQLLLSLVLPLMFLDWSELLQRRQFAAEHQAALERRQARRRGAAAERAGVPVEWGLSFDGMRLLVLLALVQARIFLAVRFGTNWHPWLASIAAGWGWGGTGGDGGPPLAAPLHLEL